MYHQPVHNYHLDGYGHVNNARYLEFLEAARWHFFAELDLKAALRQAQLVVSHMDIRYRRAASLDDELQIHTELIAVQSRQIQVAQRIECSSKICVSATVTLMPTDAQGRVFRLPESLYQACVQRLAA
ncbi:acyl-CoA thioesterase [Neisseriaceae bacterium B1]